MFELKGLYSFIFKVLEYKCIKILYWNEL